MSWVEKNGKINSRGGTIIRDSRVYKCYILQLALSQII